LRNFIRLRCPKTAALAAAAVFYVPLVADWCAPGPWLDQAAAIVGDTVGLTHPVLWDALVRLVGRDVPLLGAISMAAAFVCTVLVAVLAGDLAALALCRMRRRVSMTDEAAKWIRHRVEFLAALSFVLTPGLLRAATHVGPVHVFLIPLLASLVLLLRLLVTVGDSPYERLKRSLPQILLALALLGCALFEMSLARSPLLSERETFVVFIAVGVFPLVTLLHLTRRRLLLTRQSYVRFFAGWLLVIGVSGFFSLQQIGRGRSASGVVRHILDNGGNFQAVVSNGPLDAMFFFMLPEGRRLIRLSRDGDVAYGRELSEWVWEHFPDRPELAYAAELGPKAFTDEWTGDQREGRQEALLTPDRYFPTLKAWREGYAELSETDGREPYGAQLRALLGAAGNRFADRALEQGDAAGAWQIFWEVLRSVDPGNRHAAEGLCGMLERGYAATAEERERLDGLLEAGGGVGSFAGRRGPSADVAGRSKEQKRDALSSHAKALLQAASEKTHTAEEALNARATIRRGLESGLVSLEQVGTLLLTLDCRLEDWKAAEKDALDILRHNRRHAKANAVMGKLAGRRRDYRAAEHYLELALAGGDDGQGTLAKDLAQARAARKPVRTSSASSVPPPATVGSVRETFSGVIGRLLLAVVLIVLTYAVESSLLRQRARLERKERAIMSKCRARMEAAYRAERERTVVRESAEHAAESAAPGHRPYKQLTEVEREARKDWARARLMKHSRNPDWDRDEEYLELVLESALGGCGEAMNKLGEYAFRRRAYVEEYYWAIKVEMAGVRNTGRQPIAILRQWLKHRTSKGRHGYHSGFFEDEYHFARAVMRVRSGVDRDKGLARLRQLVRNGYEDAVLFAQKNGLERDTD